MIVPVLAQVGTSQVAGQMLDKGDPRAPVSPWAGLMAAGLVFAAFGFPAQNLWLVVTGAILGSAGF